MNFKRTTRSAFTLVEAVVAMAVCGIMIVALYSGITSGFFHIRMARENFRATQIMVEKMEVIRLLTWDQINSNGFVPATFSAPYYPDNSTSATNSASGGLVYNGTITITDVPNS